MITNLINKNGNAAANQFIITECNNTTFQSYSTKICTVHHASATISFNPHALKYSKTTNKYLYMFLEDELETLLTVPAPVINKKTVEKWIETGRADEIQLYDTSWSVKVWNE